MVDLIGYSMLIVVVVSYAISPRVFDLSNLFTFIPLIFVGLAHKAYPNVLISLFFGIIAIHKVYKDRQNKKQ